MQRVLLVVGAAVFFHTAVAAQTCEGQPSFASGGTQAGAGAMFADGINSFGGTIGMGRSMGAYGRAAIAMTSYDNFDGSSFNVGGSVGYQVPVGRTSALQLCPTGNFNFEFGPNDLGDLGFDASGRSFGFGVKLGTALPSGPKVSIVPNGGLSFAYKKMEIEDADGGDFFEASESYGVLNLGLGFVFNTRLGVVPTIMIPIGLANSEAAFGLNAVLHFGTPR